jgi:hypothetical protein
VHFRSRQFENCPKQFFHVRVAKDVVDKQTEATRWGELVHKAFEDRARDSTALPEHLAQHEPMMARLTSLAGEKLIEARLGLTHNFLPCGFFAKEVWYRGVVDYGVVNGTKAVVIDYKTTRSGVHAEVALQLAAYARGEIILQPDGTEIPLPEIHGAAVLHLRPEGWKLVPVAITDEVFEVFAVGLKLVHGWDTELSKGVLGKPIMSGEF